MAKIPKLAGDFARIYVPQPGRFPGPDSEHLQGGQWVENWIANDHTFVRDAEGRWHAFGIIGPETAKLHEGTWQAFHISSRPGPFRSLTSTGFWTEHEKVLPASTRPGERRELWAPFVVEREGVYYMFYGPCEMRVATSVDLFQWTPAGTGFEQEGSARDPWIEKIDGEYHMVYVAGRSIWLRTSGDLRSWSETPREIFAMRRPGAPESPMLIAHDSRFHLFWTIHDGQNGPYDDRTFVFGSDRPDDFQQAKLVAELQVHAPEIVREGDEWTITSAENPWRGIAMAPMEWR